MAVLTLRCKIGALKHDSTEYAAGTRSLELTLEKMGWNKDIFDYVKMYLDEANCISIEIGEPTKIGFKRGGFGKYSYDIFNNPIPVDQRASFNDSCRYVIYDDYLVLKYGGGALGPQCFPDFR